MNLDERYARWIKASIGAGAVDAFFMPTIQGLGRLDCEIISEDQRFRALDQKGRESAQESTLLTRRFTLSYLWVIGSFENLRTMHGRMEDNRGKFPDSATQRANRVKKEFVKIRSPLTKMKPINPHGEANSPIAYPALGPDLGVAWQIGPQTFISRLDLSNLFLEFLEDLWKSGRPAGVSG
jgi:hypothetical protein